MTYISTSHELARELLRKPDGFISVKNGEIEYSIESISRTSTCANIDDSIMYWALNVRECNGNVKR